MKKLFLIFLFFASSWAAYAQNPDCQWSVTFVGAGRQGTAAAPAAPTAFPALSSATGTPCVSWHITYQTIGSVTVSLSFQGVNDNGLTPGSTFTTMGAACASSNPCTIVTGTNPLTDAVNSYLAVTGYFPWVSLLMNTCTGCSSTNTVVVKGIGFRSFNAVESVNGTVGLTAGTTVGLNAGTNNIGKVDVLGNIGAIFDAPAGGSVPANVLQVGGTDGVLLRVYKMDPCAFGLRGYFVVSVAANTQIVSGLANNNVYICQVFIAPVAAATNVNIVESATSGNACATSPTGMMGGATAALGANLATNGGFVLPFAQGFAWMRTAVQGDAVCIFTSAQVNGVIEWVQNNP